MVGVTTDDEVLRIKGAQPIIPFEERKKIISAIRFVDKVIPEENVDKLKAWHTNKFDVIFKGDDWKGSKKWNKFEKEFEKLEVEVQYFSYTKGTSSTELRETLQYIKTNERNSQR